MQFFKVPRRNLFSKHVSLNHVREITFAPCVSGKSAVSEDLTHVRHRKDAASRLPYRTNGSGQVVAAAVGRIKGSECGSGRKRSAGTVTNAPWTHAVPPRKRGREKDKERACLEGDLTKLKRNEPESFSLLIVLRTILFLRLVPPHSNLAYVQTIFVARQTVRHKTRLPLAASARCTLFGPPVFNDKRAAVGVLAESSALCARAAEDAGRRGHVGLD
ncbi:hypothetical protein ALC53_10401 [Atta colombica]|uniref:Uncharacterized protein n=1 Tax=Atta colombica TaxID=520822 RepID=A0A195B4N4_9HYME|nr:hypothetical protein ALC53_10401 [Atta colombica]